MAIECFCVDAVDFHSFVLSACHMPHSIPCLPVLLYGVSIRGLSYACTRQALSIEFTATRSLMKLFQTGSTVVSDCMTFFQFLPVSHQIDTLTAKFLENFICSENYIAHRSKVKLTVTSRKSSLFVVIPCRCRYNFRARLSSCEVSLLLCVFLRFFFVVAISFSLHAMLPLLAKR